MRTASLPHRPSLGEAPFYLALAWVRSCALALVSVAAGAGGEVGWSL